MLKKIKINNFKSLKDCEIELKVFNILVGANGSGKTNFIDLFKLLQKVYAEREISPFLDWWGYDNIVWKRDENLPITIKLFFEEAGYEFSFETTLTGVGGKFQILREEIEVKDFFSLRKEGEQLTVTHNPVFFQEALGKIPQATLKKLLIETGWEKVLKKKDELQSQEVKLRIKSSQEFGITESVLFLRGIGGYTEEGKFSITPFFTTPTLYILAPVAKVPKIPKAMRGMFTLPMLVNRSISDFINKATLLKTPSYSEIRNPSRPKRQTQLSEGAGELVNVLYSLFLKENKLPQRTSIMSYIFPGTDMRFDLTADGRILLIVREGKIDLYPPSLPDGFYKTLMILTALELNPGILLIDEVENTLHPRALELLFDEIKTSGVQTVLTTHSPAVIDLAQPEDLILVERDPEEGSKFRRIENPEKVKIFLRERGLTLSERWLYGRV